MTPSHRRTRRITWRTPIGAGALSLALGFAWGCSDSGRVILPVEEAPPEAGPVPNPAGPVDASVTAVPIPGNPSCGDLGYDFGWKPQPEPPPSGTYAFPDGINTLELSSDGTYFDWTSTLGIDAVIVKGGPNANVYVYDPEASGDTQLNSPTNPNNLQPYAISHIEFCYDYEVDVSKDASTTYTRNYDWTIDKTSETTSVTLDAGESTDVDYTITAMNTDFSDGSWAVSGSILIENNTPFAATITAVSDVVSPDIAASVDCGVTFPYELAAGNDLTCSYSTGLPDAAGRTNTATVTTSGTVGGGQGTAAVTFGDPTTEVDQCVDISDEWPEFAAKYPGAEACSGESPKEFTYTATLTAPALFEGETCTDGSISYAFENTATLYESEDDRTDDHTVTAQIQCLAVAKDAQTSYNRYWDWTITKLADAGTVYPGLMVSPGQIYAVNYDVTVDASSTDDDFAVTGNITITNISGSDIAVSVADEISGGISATVNCPAASVPAASGGTAGTLTCSYSADLPDGTDRTNTATVTAFTDKTYPATADVSFDETPDGEFDECIDVDDTNVGSLGAVCATDVTPKVFQYALNFSTNPGADVMLVCGDNQHDNTASFTTNDNGNTNSATESVYVNVPCEGGCSLTPGYWKTHSEYGPAPYDDTWALLPNGADTPFFLSGQTFYEVLWTAPRGNVYYILAHAYIAAALNFLNGSDPTAAMDAFNAAVALLEQYTPAAAANLRGPARKAFTDAATVLDDYNNGLIGPGHCSEDGSSS